MWELLCDRACAVPCASLSSVLISGACHWEEPVDYSKADKDIQEQVDLIHIPDNVDFAGRLEPLSRRRERTYRGVYHALNVSWRY